MTHSHEGRRRSIVVVCGTVTFSSAALLALSFISPWQRPMPQPPAPTLEAGLVELAAPTAPAPPAATPPPAEESAVRQPSPAPPTSPPKGTSGKSKVRSTPHRTAPSSDPAPSPTTEQPSSTPQPSPDKGPAGGTSGARAIFQPLPDIPADLRRHALDVVARVRFTIASDGTATAELIEATPDPRLNQVLLETFLKWRFFPAVEQGKPTASVLVLTVPISIR